MTSQELAVLMLHHAANLHPNYSREQQMLWALGLLSDVVLSKNLNDNIVFETLNARIDQLYEQQRGLDHE